MPYFFYLFVLFYSFKSIDKEGYMQFRKGSCRYVFIFKKRVVKIPRLSSWKSFVFGILEQWKERYWYCADYSKWEGEWKYPLAEIYYSNYLGFLTVMEHCTPLKEIENWKEKYKEEYDDLIKWGEGVGLIDDKDDNIGLNQKGKLVWLDYGYVCTNTYLGNPLRVVYNRKNGTKKYTLYWKVRSFFYKLEKLIKRK